MLDSLRKNSRTFGIYFMFAAIIVVFGFTFGAISPDQACGGRIGGMDQGDLVKVDGAEVDTTHLVIAGAISIEPPPPKSGRPDFDYRMSRFRILNMIGPASGAAFARPFDEVHPVPFVKFVDDLVETKLVSNYAKGLGLGVSEKEMNDRLAPFLNNFRDEKTGRFERDRFTSWLANNQIPASRFEAFVRDEILREKAIQLLVNEVSVTDAEIDAAYRLGNEKVQVETIAIDSTSARALVPVSEQEVAQWLTTNGEKVATEYEKRKATEFTTPKNWKVRAIRFDAPDLAQAADDEQKTGLEEARKEIRTKADGVLAALKTRLAEPGVDEAGVAIAPSTNFAQFAQENSDDTVSKAMGGMLKSSGLTEAELGRPPYGPAVMAAVTAATPGTVSDIVDGGSAFWIFHVDAIEESRTDSLDEVRSRLAKRLIQEERAEAFKKSLADEVLNEAKKAPKSPLADIAKLLNEKYGVNESEGLQVRQNMSFARLQDDRTPFLFGLNGRAPKLVRAAFAANAENPVLPEVYTIDPVQTLVVARFVALTPAAEMTAEEREESRKAMVFERQRDLYRGWYEDLVAKKKASGALEYTSFYEKQRVAAEQSFVQSGGVLPMTAALPAEAPAAPGATAPAAAQAK